MNQAESACAVFDALYKNTFVEETWKSFDIDFIINLDFSSYQKLALVKGIFKASYKLQHALFL